MCTVQSWSSTQWNMNQLSSSPSFPCPHPLLLPPSPSFSPSSISSSSLSPSLPFASHHTQWPPLPDWAGNCWWYLLCGAGGCSHWSHSSLLSPLCCGLVWWYAQQLISENNTLVYFCIYYDLYYGSYLQFTTNILGNVFGKVVYVWLNVVYWWGASCI